MTDTAPTAMGNDNDDWEVAVDTGEFDKRLEQQEKARAANQEPVISPVITTGNDDDNRNPAGINLMKSNKPIRILKRPTSQSQLPTNNDVTKSLITTTTATSTAFNNTPTMINSNSLSSTNTSSSTTVPIVSIIPRIQIKDSTNSSQSINTPSSTASSSQSSKPAIKTYEQREHEYRLARLRIMGEEESSTIDDDNLPTTDSTFVSTDDSNKTTTSSTTKTTTKTNSLSQQPLQCHSTPGSYASNLYTLNNVPSNTGTIYFTPNNTNNNSTPNLGSGLFSSPSVPQNYRGAYPVPYSHMPPPTVSPRYPYTTTTTTTTSPYMTSTAPFVNAPSSSSSSSVSSSYNYPPQQHANMSTNNWYNYQHSQTPSGAQQFGHPQ